VNIKDRISSDTVEKMKFHDILVYENIFKTFGICK